MGNYAVYHSEKGNISSGGIGNHIDRKEGAEHTYRHADSNKKDLNQFFNLNSYCSMPLHQAIEERIKEGYKSPKAIRKDAVKYTTHILTGSHERMKEIEKNPELLKNWIIENKRFLEKEFGKDNIVRFVIHRDEKTPHIHAVTVNLTSDGRLSAKEIIGNKKTMQSRQDRYAQSMESFRLKRGIKNIGIKHEDASEYYKRLNYSLEIENIKDFNINKSILGIKWATFGIDKDKTIENLQKAVKSQITTIKSKDFEIKDLEYQKALINHNHNHSLEKIKELENEIIKSKNKFENILVNDSDRNEILERRLNNIIRESELIINNHFYTELDRLSVANKAFKKYPLKIKTIEELKELINKYISPNKFNEVFIDKIKQKNEEIKYKKVSNYLESWINNFKEHEDENRFISLRKYDRFINESLGEFNLEGYNENIIPESSSKTEKILSSYVNQFMGENYFEKNIIQGVNKINKRIEKEIDRLEQIKEERRNNRSRGRSW